MQFSLRPFWLLFQLTVRTSRSGFSHSPLLICWVAFQLIPTYEVTIRRLIRVKVSVLANVVLDIVEIVIVTALAHLL